MCLFVHEGGLSSDARHPIISWDKDHLPGRTSGEGPRPSSPRPSTWGRGGGGVGAWGSVDLRLKVFLTMFNERYVFCAGEDMPVSRIYSVLWDIFQPLLFGLIGAEIDISRIEGKTIGLGIAVLVIGLTLRMIASFLAVFGTG